VLYHQPGLVNDEGGYLTVSNERFTHLKRSSLGNWTCWAEFFCSVACPLACEVGLGLPVLVAVCVMVGFVRDWAPVPSQPIVADWAMVLLPLIGQVQGKSDKLLAYANTYCA
jgi:hypothetical protein